jgi:hypothetical protein
MRKRRDQPGSLAADAADAWLFLRVLLFTILVPVLFRLRLPLVRRVLSARGVGRSADSARTDRVIACVRAAQRVGRPLVRPGCLTRGTALYWFLRGAGLDVELCFGAGFPGRGFEGHCWLERTGEPYLEVRDPRGHFAEVFRVPARGHMRPA